MGMDDKCVIAVSVEVWEGSDKTFCRGALLIRLDVFRNK